MQGNPIPRRQQQALLQPVIYPVLLGQILLKLFAAGIFRMYYAVSFYPPENAGNKAMVSLLLKIVLPCIICLFTAILNSIYCTFKINI